MPDNFPDIIQSWEHFKEIVTCLDSEAEDSIRGFYAEEKKKLFDFIDDLTGMVDPNAIYEKINLIEAQFHYLHEIFYITHLKEKIIKSSEHSLLQKKRHRDLPYRLVHRKMLMYIHKQREAVKLETLPHPNKLETLFQLIGPISTHKLITMLFKKLSKDKGDKDLKKAKSNTLSRVDFDELIVKINLEGSEHLKRVCTHFFKTCQIERLSIANSLILKVSNEEHTEVLKIEKSPQMLMNIAHGLYLAKKLRETPEAERPPLEMVFSQPMTLLYEPIMHCTIMPYMPKKDLSHACDQIKFNRHGAMYEIIDDVAKGVFFSLKFMEDKGFFYTDAKPHNWLFHKDESGIRFGIGDLKSIYLVDDHTFPAGAWLWRTIGYAPPEYQETNATKIKPYHSYEMGVLLLRILVGGARFNQCIYKKDPSVSDHQKIISFIYSKDRCRDILCRPKGKKYLFLIKQLTNKEPEHRPCISEAYAFLNHLDSISEAQLSEFSIYKDYYQIAKHLGLDVSEYAFPKIESLWNTIEYPLEAVKTAVMNELRVTYGFLNSSLIKATQNLLSYQGFDITSKGSFVVALKEMDERDCRTLNDATLYYHWAMKNIKLNWQPFPLFDMVLNRAYLNSQLSSLKTLITRELPRVYDFLKHDELNLENMREVLPVLYVCKLIKQAITDLKTSRPLFFTPGNETMRMCSHIEFILQNLLTFNDMKTLNDLKPDALEADSFERLPQNLKYFLHALNKCYDIFKGSLKEADKHINHFSSFIEGLTVTEGDEHSSALNASKKPKS